METPPQKPVIASPEIPTPAGSQVPLVANSGRTRRPKNETGSAPAKLEGLFNRLKTEAIPPNLKIGTNCLILKPTFPVSPKHPSWKKLAELETNRRRFIALFGIIGLLIVSLCFALIVFHSRMSMVTEATAGLITLFLIIGLDVIIMTAVGLACCGTILLIVASCFTCLLTLVPLVVISKNLMFIRFYISPGGTHWCGTAVMLLVFQLIMIAMSVLYHRLYVEWYKSFFVTKYDEEVPLVVATAPSQAQQPSEQQLQQQQHDEQQRLLYQQQQEQCQQQQLYAQQQQMQQQQQEQCQQQQQLYAQQQQQMQEQQQEQMYQQQQLEHQQQMYQQQQQDLYQQQLQQQQQEQYQQQQLYAQQQQQQAQHPS